MTPEDEAFFKRVARHVEARLPTSPGSGLRRSAVATLGAAAGTGAPDNIPRWPPTEGQTRGDPKKQLEDGSWITDEKQLKLERLGLDKDLSRLNDPYFVGQHADAISPLLPLLKQPVEQIRLSDEEAAALSKQHETDLLDKQIETLKQRREKLTAPKEEDQP